MRSGDEANTHYPSSAKEALDQFKKYYPRYRLWQLAVDGALYSPRSDAANKRLGKKRESGWVKYEKREPGSLKAFFSGLNKALEKIDDKKINIELIKDLHKAVSTNVRGKIEQQLVPGQLRSNQVNFRLKFSQQRVTLEGLTDLLTKIENYEFGDLEIDDNDAGIKFKIKKDNQTKSELISSFNIKKYKKKRGLTSNEQLAQYLLNHSDGITYQAPGPSVIDCLLQNIIENYNKKIDTLNTADEILNLIGETIQAFERVHPFSDANGRTFANLLLTRLLIQNGFPPATLYDPNLFDAYGNHVAVLKQGIQNTLDIYDGNDIFDFNINSELTEYDLSFFEVMDELNRFTNQTSKIQMQEINKYLVTAITNDDVIMIEGLLMAGAKIGPLNIPPLHYAIMFNAIKVINFLLKNNYDPNLKFDGVTPLMLAVEHGNYKVIYILLENRANCLLFSDEGETALSIAKKHGHTDIEKILKNRISAVTHDLPIGEKISAISKSELFLKEYFPHQEGGLIQAVIDMQNTSNLDELIKIADSLLNVDSSISTNTYRFFSTVKKDHNEFFNIISSLKDEQQSEKAKVMIDSLYENYVYNPEQSKMGVRQ